MGTPGQESWRHGVAAMRRGSYDDTAASLRPHLRSLAQRRRSAPSLAFGRALGMPWSPIREETSCWVAVEQCPFVLGLSSENGELLLDECVQVTEGNKTRERHLFLFSDVIIFAKLKSSTSYRVKHRVNLEDMWLYGFEDELEDEEGGGGGGGGGGDVDLRTSMVMAWSFALCMVSFCSPEVKERWLDTLHGRKKEARERADCISPAALMKVPNGGVTTKALTGVMEAYMEFPLDGDQLPKQLCNPEDRVTQTIENKWNKIRNKLRRSATLPGMLTRTDMGSKTQLFGRPLCKTCPDDHSLPKPVAEMLVLLWQRGPSTEGVFRKPANLKNLRSTIEQLNSGAVVNMEALPVVLLVGLLKSFLKELPGSLLVSELYDTWIKALAAEDVPQRTAQIKRVVEKLPGPNRLLLQHLLSVLCHILESADTNKMDAHNLALCIAPTLLQLDDTPLDEQKGKMDKVTELTQFLIEHCCDTLGENILNLLGEPDEDNSDSQSSQQHDSAYDSPDPDAEAEPGGGVGSARGEASASSPSLLYSCAAVPSCSSDAIFHTFTKPSFSRRRSEPIIFPPAELRGLHGPVTSRDDCSLGGRGFQDDRPLKKQISEDLLLLDGRGGTRPALSLPKLGEPVAYTTGSRVSRSSYSSSCSLESAASNQSEGSVFTSSPLTSPAFPRRANPTHQVPFNAKPRQEAPRADVVVKRRSQSMRVDTKVPLLSKSLGAFSFSRCSLKKERHFPCGTLREDSQSEAEPQAELRPRPRPLSAIEVFQQVDGRLPCRPPSYEQAVQSAAQPAPPDYRSMTVQSARELGRKSRPTSVSEDFLSTCPVNRYADCFPPAGEDEAGGVELRLPFRQRAASESVSRARQEALSRRCSQPLFEEYSYAKESYV